MKTLFLISSLLFSLACSSSKPTDKTEIDIDVKSAVQWHRTNTIYPILDKAVTEDKVVFLDIYTDWCLPCKMMDQDVFSDQQIGDLLAKDFISYKVNAEKENGPDLNFLFGVKQYPTLLFLDSKGNELLRAEGAIYQTELRQLMLEALALKPLNSSGS